MTELNERQLTLYNYLIKQMQDADHVRHIKLMIDLDEWYHRSKERNSLYNSTAYRRLRKDIDTINKSSAQYAILSYKEKNKLIGYKLADRNEDIIKQADLIHAKVLRLLKLERKLRKKAGNNGQLRIASGSETKEIRSEVKR